MLYASWVLYYSVCKRKYAFYHKAMPNIFLVAMLSIIAVLTPVIFFITDISNQSIAGWGDYFRWVGAAAASVIVWEWVERIEALEREEKKDGILGREVFDGDDVLGSVDSEEVIWPRPRGFWASQGWKQNGSRGGGSGGGSAFTSGQDVQKDLPPHRTGQTDRAIAFVKSKTRRTAEKPTKRAQPRSVSQQTDHVTVPPPAAVSPVSRADTTSPASTIYTVRYHNGVTPVSQAPASQRNFASLDQTMHDGRTSPTVMNEKTIIEEDDDESQIDQQSRVKFHIGNPFKRGKSTAPEAVRAGQVIEPVSIGGSTTQPTHQYSTWDVKGKIGAFAADQGEKWREKKRGEPQEKDLPVTIIPAQPRGRTWSPDSAVALDPPGTSGQATIASRLSTSEGEALDTTPGPSIPLPRTMNTSPRPSSSSRGNGGMSQPPPRPRTGVAPSVHPGTSSPPPPWTPDTSSGVPRTTPSPTTLPAITPLSPLPRPDR